ncbi:MAG: hypothetical protein GY929_27550 [Actinomycetia bacterium]|nr:hypothetical protein [Actinomycetes bacterium]
MSGNRPRDKAAAILADLCDLHNNTTTTTAADDLELLGTRAIAWALLDIADAIRNGSDYERARRSGRFGPG